MQFDQTQFPAETPVTSESSEAPAESLAGVSATPARQSGLRFGFIGMGKVGPSLASAFRQAGNEIVAVAARSPESRERVEAMLPGVPIQPEDQVAAASDVVFLTVKDAQIALLVEQLAAAKAFRSGQLVVHTSGARGLEDLAPAAQAGALTLAMHPAMTFMGYSLDVERLAGTTIAITGNPLVTPLAKALVQSIGAIPVQIDERDRVLYHCGLTYGANYLVTLVAGARRILMEAGIDEPQTVLQPLLQAALDNVLTNGIDALTGPVQRGDEATIRAHLAALETTEALHDLAEAYTQLAKATEAELRERPVSAGPSTTLSAAALAPEFSEQDRDAASEN